MKKKITTNNLGFIKIHRNILNWEWYDDINTKVLFIHCLLKAYYKDTKKKGKIIKRGSFEAGRIELAKETGLSIQNIRTSLSKLKSTNELTIKSTSKFSIISVVNYDFYQNINQQINQQTNKRLTSNQPATNQQLTTLKEVKEVKKKKYKVVKRDNDFLYFTKNGINVLKIIHEVLKDSHSDAYYKQQIQKLGADRFYALMTEFILNNHSTSIDNISAYFTESLKEIK